MEEQNKREPGVGLALSGGGFRATLFHLGSLWRLNELGWLPKLTRVCSVSGGSITAGVLGHHWKRLSFNDNDVAANFVQEIVNPLRNLCSRNIDVPSVLGGALSIFKTASDLVISRYNAYLFKDATLQDLPDDGEGPRFVIYATNLQTGSSVRFSKPYLADYKIGMLENPDISMATAVAASSAFPPILTPVIIRLNPNDWKKVKGAYLFDDRKMREKMYLSDGGVYDNLGLEAIWDRYQTVIVSDAGAPFEFKSNPWKLKYSQVIKTIRTLEIMNEQTRALRKRKLIQDYISNKMKGTYWGITTDIDDYHLDDALVRDNDKTRSLQTMRTRLNPFSEEEQGRLINWGYALADAAMRRHVLDPGISPGTWPDSDFPLG